MVFMALDNFDKTLICLLTRRKVILRVGKGIVKVQVIYLYSNSFELRVSFLDRAQPFVVEHRFSKPEIACM